MTNTNQIQMSADLLKEAGIPKSFWSLDSDTYYGCALALKKVAKYVRNAENGISTGVGMLFVGDSQTLKTFLMTYALKCLASKGYDIRYTTLDRIEEIYFNKNGDQPSFEGYATDSHFLALDNVDEIDEKSSIKKKALIRLVRARSDAGLPTFIATTYPLEAFKAHYPHAAVETVEANSVVIETSVDAFKKEAFLDAKKAAVFKSPLV